MESWSTSMEAPFYDEDELACRSMHRKVYRFFSYQPRLSGTYSNLPVRDTGCLALLQKNITRLMILNLINGTKMNIETWYYTTNLHTGAFMLPKYVEDLLEEEEME